MAFTRHPWLWSLAVIGGGLLIGFLLLWTAPQTQPEEAVRAAKIVQTLAISPQNERISVLAEGPVIAARKVVVKPEVRGRVVRHHPSLVPGGFIKAGEELVGIDPSDYLLALTEQQTALEEARFELEIEKGRQVVASREWKLLESDLAEGQVNQSLVLREPHLRRTEAMLSKATNEIAKARLSLERTSVGAPFNCMVVEESMEIGQLVEPGNPICTLAGTDEFWVQATLSLDKLKWIQTPGPDQAGPPATVILDTGNGEPATWQGTVFRLLSDLEPLGRMARVLVRVPDPLGLSSGGQKLPLLLGSYVRVEIDAGELKDVLSIPRAALREGERIWVVNENKEVRICEIEIHWPRKESVLVANCLRPGEQLILSGLRTALPGMKVEPQPAAEPGARPANRITARAPEPAGGLEAAGR